AVSDLRMYLSFLAYMGASAGLYLALTSIVPLKPNRLTALWVAGALNAYYWYNALIFANKLHEEYGWSVSQPLIWSIRGLVFALTLLFLYRTYRKEDRFAADL